MMVTTPPLAPIFDSHAHYDDAAFDADRDTLLAALPAQGVCGVINAATDPASARRCIALARRYPYIRAAVGIHPECAAQAQLGWITEITALIEADRRTGSGCICAIGEIGLDYHYPDGAPREVQLALFRQQLALANELGLPVIVHDRDAHADTLALLQEYRPQGVLHCFSGSVELLREVLALGMSIGLGGAVTFKNAKKPVAVAAAVPADRLLLETDAPYMAPEPCRGQRCHSAMIAYTAQRIAALRDEPVQTLLQQTAENARRLFRL